MRERVYIFHCLLGWIQRAFFTRLRWLSDFNDVLELSHDGNGFRMAWH